MGEQKEGGPKGDVLPQPFVSLSQGESPKDQKTETLRLSQWREESGNHTTFEKQEPR